MGSSSTAAFQYAQAASVPQAVPPPPQSLGSRSYRGGFRRASDSRDPNIKRISNDAPQGSTLAAVVITISRGNSYDRLFQTVPQVGDEGTHVATYTASGKSLFHILRALTESTAGPVTSPDFQELLADIRSVEPSVVFNWECCSTCAHGAFHEPHEDPRCREVVMNLMHLLLRRGHMVMCSDFSLKALIKQWSESRLGPNPFVKIGEFGGSMQLNFDPSTLAGCPSAQLQKAGEMSSDGSAILHAMPSTIAYTVDMRKADTSAYTLEVLTVASGMDGIDVEGLPPHLTCEAAGHRGAAGHVILRYPSGGMLLVSAGHWVELSNIGVTEERLLEVAAASYGAAYSAEVSTRFASCTTVVERNSLVQSMAQQYVQQSPPCSIRPSSLAMQSRSGVARAGA